MWWGHTKGHKQSAAQCLLYHLARLPQLKWLKGGLRRVYLRTRITTPLTVLHSCAPVLSQATKLTQTQSPCPLTHPNSLKHPITGSKAKPQTSNYRIGPSFSLGLQPAIHTQGQARAIYLSSLKTQQEINSHTQEISWKGGQQHYKLQSLLHSLLKPVCKGREREGQLRLQLLCANGRVYRLVLLG